MEPQMLLEMAEFGTLEGKKLTVKSDDHAPPHFHFGKVKIELYENPPRNATELRSRILFGGNMVKDEELTKLIRLLNSPFAPLPMFTVYSIMKTQWVVFHPTEANFKNV